MSLQFIPISSDGRLYEINLFYIYTAYDIIDTITYSLSLFFNNEYIKQANSVCNP